MWNVGKEWSTRKKRGCRQNPVHNVRMIKSLSTVIYARLLFQQPKSSLHNDSQKYKNITNLFCTRFIFTTCGVFTSAFAVFFYAALILAGAASCVYICLKRCNRVEKKRFIEHVRVFKIVPNVHIHFNPNQIQTAIIRCAKSANKTRRIYLNDVDIMIIFFH